MTKKHWGAWRSTKSRKARICHDFHPISPQLFLQNMAALKCRVCPSVPPILSCPHALMTKKGTEPQKPSTYLPHRRTTGDLGKISITRQFMITASERSPSDHGSTTTDAILRSDAQNNKFDEDKGQECFGYMSSILIRSPKYTVHNVIKYRQFYVK